MNRCNVLISALVCLALLHVNLVRAEAEKSKSQAQLIAAVLQPFVDDHILAGAVTAVADKHKILDLEAVGFADVASKKPMTTDSLFWIASQSKPITATALMILVDEGKVNVDDPVEKYLPEFKGQMVAERDSKQKDAKIDTPHAPKHPILVRNVLSHTSGLPFKTEMETPTLDIFPLADRVKSYGKATLDFEPDTKSQYANAGINTVGRIIEVVSGMPYEKFLQTRIFEPLEMKDTTFFPNKEQIERLAKSYKVEKGELVETPIGQLKYPLDDPERRPMPAGGLFSTATDLCHFYQMLINKGEFHGKRILSEKSLEMMTSKQTGDLKVEYGFGFSVGGHHIGHGGAYNTNSSIDTEHHLIEIFLVQHAGWKPEGKKILPAFQKAAVEDFGK
jgi:CubicO group peptidase (beta-lactamase class C family)